MTLSRACFEAPTDPDALVRSLARSTAAHDAWQAMGSVRWNDAGAGRLESAAWVGDTLVLPGEYTFQTFVDAMNAAAKGGRWTVTLKSAERDGARWAVEMTVDERGAAT